VKNVGKKPEESVYQTQENLKQPTIIILWKKKNGITLFVALKNERGGFGMK